MMPTMGSLFDGSGGFPLAAAMNGMIPVWASEIEAYPLRVTARRFPQTEQLGDVKDIDGSLIEPVDAVTFGSPCQDLSVAGAQAGIKEGSRSCLFFEAVRIICEMRRITNGKYPRFAVWENVPGAFSSNKGADFRAILQALCEIADPNVLIPEPPRGGWTRAGCIVGKGFSLAWRTYDAQFFGVPQRRKRIYLIADFGSERAGEILFERESVRGYPAQSREAREGTAADAEGSACGSCYAFHLQQDPIGGSVSPCIGGQHQAIGGVFMGGQGAKAGSIAYDEAISPTLRAMPSGSNQVPDIVYSIQGNVIDREVRQNGTGVCEGVSHTVNTQDRHAVAFDCRNMVGNVEISGTLQAKNEGGFSLNFINPVVYDTTQITCPKNYSNPKLGDPCHPLAARQHPPMVVCAGNGQLNQISMAQQSNTLDCMHDQQIVLIQRKRRYIVRRLTPLECCRLQGFPDWWEDGAEGSDSARYKMWGNGIALPCAFDVMHRIAKELNSNGKERG